MIVFWTKKVPGLTLFLTCDFRFRSKRKAKMYILDNADYHLDYFDIENYELNAFQILQNF